MAQDAPLVISFVRQSDGLAWLMKTLDGLLANLDFPSLGIRIPLSEIFRGIDVASI